MGLTKIQVNYIKGFAIILIILHNFFHLTLPVIGENEFNFNKKYFDNYLNYAFNDIISFIKLSFSYFGHYGVQLFIFCSGYGLSKSYINNPISFKEFIKKRSLKIYPVFIIVTIAALIFNHFFKNYQFGFRSLGTIILRLSPVVNWIPKKALGVSGPFWFYSMILQLYLLFYPILYLKKTRKVYFYIVVFSLFITTIFTNNFFSSNDISLYYNFVGNITVFSIGIVVAFSKKSISTISIINKFAIYFLAIIIFITGQFNNVLWHFTQVSFLIISIPVILMITKKSNNFISNKIIGIVGFYSMYLFAVSGFLRQPWVLFYNSSKDYLSKLLIFFTYIIIVIISSKTLMLFEKIILKKYKSLKIKLGS